MMRVYVDDAMPGGVKMVHQNERRKPFPHLLIEASQKSHGDQNVSSNQSIAELQYNLRLHAF